MKSRSTKTNHETNRYEVRPTNKRGRLQIFDCEKNQFVQDKGYKPHEAELAERHCAMLNHGEQSK